MKNHSVVFPKEYFFSLLFMFIQWIRPACTETQFKNFCEEILWHLNAPMQGHGLDLKEFADFKNIKEKSISRKRCDKIL